ncbi:MAG: hypothetical protein K9L17_02785 [Clostridiales bacterium]|nr:hypothetical protein [Clostridiales bacterium]MCF8021606.1 hypothetical protein [Clostridiales bacterium]
MNVKTKRFLVLIFLILILLMQGSVVYAGEETDYEIYDRTAESMGYERPTHFLIKITGSEVVGGLLNGETLEIKEGQKLNRTFEFVDGPGIKEIGATKEYTLKVSLDFDARAMLFTGEYEFVRATTKNIKVPDKFLDMYPDGVRNEYERRTYRGPVTGMLTSSGEQKGLDGGNIAFNPPSVPPWPEIYRKLDDGTESTIELTDHDSLARVGGLQFEITEVYQTLKGDDTLAVVDTAAKATPGETPVSVPAAIVIGLAGMAAAAAGAAAGSAGAAAGSNSSGKTGSRKSTYKMIIYKEFGDKIKYDDKPVFVYARMVETDAEGVDIKRLDLTGQIEIFSEDSFMEIGPSAISGDYMGASVQVFTSGEAAMPSEGIISFSFSGEGGTFRNNVKFKMVGEPYISLEEAHLHVLAASGKNFEMPYELKDFLNEAEVTVKALQETRPFDIKLGEDKKGNPIIIATDLEEEKPIERFFESYTCEIIAENEKEYARTVFDVVMCYEGLQPDFLGKPKEIRGYKNEEGEMAETLIAFKLGLWNESSSTLDFIVPEEIEIECSDEEGVFEVIGLGYEENMDDIVEDAVSYKFKAEISMPALDPIEGKLISSCSYNGKDYKNETDISLIPDILQYEADFEKEYENCIYIINTYLPERFRDKKLEQLEKAKEKLGIEDLKLFRKTVWQIAQRAILQEKEQYLLESYWWDEVIATTELVIAMGNIAFDIALSSVGGPITGFIVAQAKDATLDFWALYVENPSIGMKELEEFLEKRFIQMVGQSDGAFTTPEPTEYKKLAAWLSCYIIYRIVYHWWYDEDKQNNPIGFVEAIKRGIYDTSGKSLSILLSDYIKNTRFKTRKVKNFAEDGQKLFDDAVQKTTGTVADFIDRIKNGGIQFT